MSHITNTEKVALKKEARKRILKEWRAYFVVLPIFILLIIPSVIVKSISDILEEITDFLIKWSKTK